MSVKKIRILFIFVFSPFLSIQVWAQTPPELTATDSLAYCPLTQINIAPSFNITNPDAAGINQIFIQISEGYDDDNDILKYNNPIPNIIALPFDKDTGKLVLKWAGTGSQKDADTALIFAVKNVVFENISATPNGERKFSITIDEKNYLPSTGHYYEYVSAPGITWTSAEAAADALPSYYGVLTPYLATITSAEEAQLSGEQAAGAGWIGGSDVAVEGTWRWMTGPEAGKSFFFGDPNGIYDGGTTVGSDIPYAFWNSLGDEPNNSDNEDYAHIVHPKLVEETPPKAIKGSWNDLDNDGNAADPNSPYYPQGYIVEYGGMPGNPILNISASTIIYIPELTTTSTPSTICGSGTTTLTATSKTGFVMWFDTLTGGIKLGDGDTYTIPTPISATTTYYALASPDGICETGERTPITATIYAAPSIISAPDVTICEGNSGTLNANASTTTATINWYTTPTGGIPFETGASFTITPTNIITTYYVDTTENGCTSPTRTEVKLEVLGNTVSAVSPITLNDITIVDDSDNNTITVNNSPGIDSYEFNLDSFDEFGTETYFEHLEPGIHSLYLRDKTNCGISKLDIAILGFPKFFTPNGDGYNDKWKVLGNDLNSIQISAIYIFNRFGKLVAEVAATGDGWDGFYNGEMLPSADYWYLVKFNDQHGDSREKQGHFSLIRR